MNINTLTIQQGTSYVVGTKVNSNNFEKCNHALFEFWYCFLILFSLILWKSPVPFPLPEVETIQFRTFNITIADIQHRDCHQKASMMHSRPQRRYPKPPIFFFPPIIKIYSSYIYIYIYIYIYMFPFSIELSFIASLVSFVRQPTYNYMTTRESVP